MMMLCVACVASAANYLTFTAEEDGSTFGIVNEGENNPNMQYSLDGGETWNALAAGDTITLAHKGDKALLRGDNPEGFSKYSKYCDHYSAFKVTGKVAASGSVMSLIDGTGLSTEIPNSHCFFGLFEYCSGLTQAPELPATTLAEDCYSFMFAGCTSLTQAPELPATTLAYGCYNCIFVRCESLSQIRVSFDEWSDAFTGDWAVSVAPTGTFICPKALPLEYGDGRIPEGWTVKYIEDMPNYLTFTAEEDGSSFGIVNNGSDNPDVQYSLDGGETWNALAAGDTVTLSHKGDKALLRGNNPEGFSKDWDQYSCFRMTGKVAASGSVMSLIDGVGISTEVPGNFCFYKLFQGCTSLTQAPELPAMTLADYCYSSMFYGCTSLTEAPELPATTLAEGCYRSMFSGCTSLTQAPELPATKLDAGCYRNMFSGCASLSEIHVSFDDWDYGMGTGLWVTNVAPTGTFICPKALALEYGEDRIPEGWTVKYIEDVSVESVTFADNITVWSDGLTVYVRGAEGEVSLYDLSGRIVATSNSKDEERALSVPSKGVYVVRTNNGTSDVLVR